MKQKLPLLLCVLATLNSYSASAQTSVYPKTKTSNILNVNTVRQLTNGQLNPQQLQRQEQQQEYQSKNPIKSFFKGNKPIPAEIDFSRLPVLAAKLALQRRDSSTFSQHILAVDALLNAAKIVLINDSIFVDDSKLFATTNKRPTNAKAEYFTKIKDLTPEEDQKFAIRHKAAVKPVLVSLNPVGIDSLSILRDKYVLAHNAIQLKIEELRSSMYAIELSRGRADIWWPTTETYQAKVLSEYSLSSSGISTLNNFALLGTKDRGSLYTEIAAGYLGVLRLALSAQLATAKDTAKQIEAIQRFIGGGGNTNLELTYPIMFFRGPSGYFENRLLGSLRGSADIPQLGTNTDDLAGNVNPALVYYAAITTQNKAFKFFLDARTGPVFGFNDFYKNLNVKAEPFSYLQANVGVILFENIVLGLTVPVWSTKPAFQHTPVRFSSQVIPNK